MKKYRSLKIIAVLLSLSFALAVCPTSVLAEPTDTTGESQSGEVFEELQPVESTDGMEETAFTEIFSELTPIGGNATADTNATASTTSAGATIPDGICTWIQ